MDVNARQVGGTHYRSDLQHWDLIELNGIGYLEACATKYITRWRKKAGKLDLEKADHYVEKLASLHQGLSARAPRGAVPPPTLNLYARENKLTSIEAEIVAILCGPWTLDQLSWARRLIQQLILEAEAKS